MIGVGKRNERASTTEKTPNTTSDATAATWTPTAEGKAHATRLRIIALVLWVLAIALEAVAIFWLLCQREWVGSDGLVRNTETGLLEDQHAVAQFPQWAFITLLVFLVVIAALAITGSILWKKANRLDPARKSDTVRFFIQNQLGAIIAIIAFLPLVILIFLNKDMSKNQKAIAGILGVVLAVGATAAGIDYNPPSVEKYTADQSTVIQLLGKDQVVWTEGGSVYHVCDQVSDVRDSANKVTGTTAEAVAAGKSRLTLKFASELKACGLNVPENADDIESALREIQAGNEGTVLPAPVWSDPSDAPISIPDAAN